MESCSNCPSVTGLFHLASCLLESPLDSKEIKLVNPKGNQPWILIGRTGAEAEAPVLWPPDEKNWLIWKDPHAGKDWRQEEKGTTEGEMVGWHHWLSGHEFEQTLGDSGGRRNLVGYSPWGCRVRHDLGTKQQQVREASRKRSRTVWFCFCEMSTVGISMETERRLPGAGVRRGWDRKWLTGSEFLSGWWRCSEIREWWRLSNFVNILKPAEWCTLRGWTL